VTDRAFVERLEEIERAFGEIEAEMVTPQTVSDPRRMVELGKRHAELKGLVENIRAWRATVRDLEDARDMSDDADMARMAATLADEVSALEARIREAIIPSDPNDTKDVILEIRSAAGGDEAALWAGDLLRMYQKYAERYGFAVEQLDAAPSEVGGYDRVVIGVKGRGAWSRLKYEGGVHRVQRVPKTESQGRIHTSTATVAVLPEAEEVEVEIDPNDLRVDVFRSTGPGGQSVNTTDSAVRLTHLPTGLVVSVQDEKSQLQNKEKAFRILRSRLLQAEQERAAAELSGERRSQVGTGERSEKIRTYNYKESRVTDHRIGLTVRRLDQILEGDLDEFVDALAADEQARSFTSEG
jgi:peptide chain release factor 1